MGDDDYTMGELVRTLRRIESDVKGLKTDVSGLSAGFVPRGEWQVWAESRDREIGELKAARAPWWIWVAALASVASLIVATVNAFAH